MTHDVYEARAEFNFSEWGLMSAREQAELRREMWHEVEEGEMPLPIYLVAHRHAGLDEAAREVLRNWAEADPHPSVVGE